MSSANRASITALRQDFEVLRQRTDQQRLLDLNDLPQSVDQALVDHIGALDQEAGVTVGELVSFLADILVAAGDKKLTNDEYGHKFSSLGRKINAQAALEGAFVIAQRATGNPTTIAQCFAENSWMVGRGAPEHAARCGDLATVMSALSKDASPETLENLAYAAAQDGHTNIIKVLLDKGLQPEAVAKAAKTALTSGHANVLEFLLDNGLSVDTVYGGDNSLLMLAAEGGYSKSKDKADIVRLLLSRGAKIDARNSFGESALHNAARYGMTESARVLVEAGADINARDNRDTTPLMNAAFDGHLGVVNLLAQDPRIEINARSKDLDTALLLASRGHDDNVKIIDALLNVPGIDVNLKDNNGYTAIMHAATGHAGGAFVQSTKRLLQAPGIDLSIRNNAEQTVMDLVKVETIGRWDRRYMVPILKGKQPAPQKKPVELLPTYLDPSQFDRFEEIIRILDEGGTVEQSELQWANDNKEKYLRQFLRPNLLIAVKDHIHYNLIPPQEGMTLPQQAEQQFEALFKAVSPTLREKLEAKLARANEAH